MNDKRKLIADTKQWIEQEKAWDGQLYASPGKERQVPGVPSPYSGEGAQRAGEGAPHSAPPPSPKRGEGTRGAKAAAFKSLYEKYKDCVRCDLGPTRIKFVFGVGPADAEVMFIGEGPGYEEDRRGEPFVGKAGQLLDKMMAAIGLDRKTNAYIANIVKCHPMANPQTPEARGNDRAPTPEEVETCSSILLRQIAVIQPRIIVTLGSPSTKMILKTKDGITGLRGKFFPFAVDAFYPETQSSTADLFAEGAAKKDADSRPPEIDSATRETLRKIQVLPTFHPAALLRNPNLKPESWADLKLLRDTLAKKS